MKELGLDESAESGEFGADRSWLESFDRIVFESGQGLLLDEFYLRYARHVDYEDFLEAMLQDSKYCDDLIELPLLIYSINQQYGLLICNITILFVHEIIYN